MQKLRNGSFSPRIQAARSAQGDFQSSPPLVEFPRSASNSAEGQTPQPKKRTMIGTHAGKPAALGWWIAFGSGIGVALLKHFLNSTKVARDWKSP